jgi:hypothetical protein
VIIAVSSLSHWPDQRRCEYVAWSAAVAAGLFGVSEWLDGEFEKAKALALQSIPNEAA